MSVGIVRLVEGLGRNFRRRFLGFFYFGGFFLQIIKETPRFFRKQKAGRKVLVLQILYTGVEALGIVSALALGLGLVIIVQGYALLPRFGQQQLMYSMLVIIITRELGPILMAFIVTARSGTAIATELASMVVSHEIEAYLAFGINPIRFLVVPRVLGVVISVVLLDVYFSGFGLLGSWIVASVFTPIPFPEYTMHLLQSLSLTDIAISLEKSLVFGIIISLAATFNGFSVEKSPTEVPVAGIRAVGMGVVGCIVTDAVLTLMFYVH